MKPITAVALGLVLASVAALAQREPSHPEPNAQSSPATPAENIGKPIGQPESGFALLDSNRDRKISREEAGASLELSTRFAEFDIDKDGSLSAPEYEVFGR